MKLCLQSLDASRPWLCYWILHSLNLLKVSLSRDEVLGIKDFLGRCQSEEEGGFCGGPGQFAHLAATYAAINAIICLNSKDALKIINRFVVHFFCTIFFGKLLAVLKFIIAGQNCWNS